MPIATPPIITEPFGKNAGGGGITLPIPVPSQILVTPGAASFNDGFPPLTMTPIAAGGIPPFGQDMNGILYMMSAHCAFINAGQPYLYSNLVATAIGGYAAGTILGRADGTGTWINIVADNMTDPDASGAGWVPGLSYGYTTITGLTNADRPLTALEASRSVIILDGALTGNINIIFPPTLQTWLVINETTGGHTVTARILSGGATVPIPAGGRAAPVGIYGDGGNLYPTVAPTVFPIDVAPTPNTLVQRSSSGYVYGTYLNQNSPAENPTVGTVFVENNSADGFLRKISISNLEAQMALQNIGGAVVAPQVPRAAVTQFYSQSYGGTNQTTWPNGTIVQYGQATISGTTTVPFPRSFPSACRAVILTNINSTNQIFVSAMSAGSFTATNGNATVSYVAFGN